MYIHKQTEDVSETGPFAHTRAICGKGANVADIKGVRRGRGRGEKKKKKVGQVTA